MPERKDFEPKERKQKDKRAKKKEERQVKQALKEHKLGWKTRDGKEF